MTIFRKLRRYVVQKRRRGFTLIEVLMAMVLTASLSGLIVGSVVNAMTMRQKALSLNRAITLAKKKMHEIKALNKTDSGRGEFPGVPGYRFEYLIREQELDPAKDRRRARRRQRDGQQRRGEIFQRTQFIRKKRHGPHL